MTKIKQFFMSGLLLLGLALVPAVANTASVQAQNFGECSGIQDCLDQGSAATDPEAEGTGDVSERVTDTAQLIVNIFSWIVGVVAVIMIIFGGFRYITSGGDSGNVGNAKNTILFAIVGLVIVALAQIIVRFVIGQLDS